MVLLEGLVESDRADRAAVPSLHSQTAACSAIRMQLIAVLRRRCGVVSGTCMWRTRSQSQNETKDPVSLCDKAELFAI